MTEAEWLAEPEPASLVRFVDGKLSPRKLRLLAVSLCRAVSHLFDHPDIHAALGVAERFADGAATVPELEACRGRCRGLAVQENAAWERAVDGGVEVRLSRLPWLRSQVAWAVAFAATTPVSVEAVEGKVSVTATQARTGDSGVFTLDRKKWDRAMAAQGNGIRALVQEHVGNPFRAAFDPAWRTETVLSLARGVYESRDFSAMPILADALQDAGCDDEDILAHCRNERQEGVPGEPVGGAPNRVVHVRGCWALDSVLGMSEA